MYGSQKFLNFAYYNFGLTPMSVGTERERDGIKAIFSAYQRIRYKDC